MRHVRAQVTEAVSIAKEMRPDLKLEGPMQYDAAVDLAVARQKVKGHSEVAGRATVCIFPDLNTGNNTYKVSRPRLPACTFSLLLFRRGRCPMDASSPVPSLPIGS
jgi:phosphotransacetylase